MHLRVRLLVLASATLAACHDGGSDERAYADCTATVEDRDDDGSLRWYAEQVYDAAGRLVFQEQDDDPSSEMDQATTYTYGETGLMTRLETDRYSAEGVPDDRCVYTYDEHDEVTATVCESLYSGEWYESMRTTWDNTYVDDLLVEAVSTVEMDPGYSIAYVYGYDDDGNRYRTAYDYGADGSFDMVALSTFEEGRVVRTDYHSGPDSGPVLYTLVWTYDDAGRMVRYTYTYEDGTNYADWTVAYDCGG